MGYMSELHFELFIEPGPDSEYAKWCHQQYLEEEKEREASFWEIECEACPIDQKEKELRVKEKCNRAAEFLKAKRAGESR